MVGDDLVINSKLKSDDVDRIRSGIPGLDQLLGGGVPKGDLILLAGRAGSGKSIFGAQYLYYGSAEKGEKSLYLTFLEDRTRVIRNARRFGFDLEEMESRGLLKVVNLAIPQVGQQGKAIEEIGKTFEEFKPARAVVDPLSALSIPLSGSKSELQSYFYSLLSKIGSFGDCTTILICEVSANADSIGSGVEEYIADGVIVLYYLMRGKAKIKAIEVRKMRGTKHSNQAVLLEISDRGISIDPEIELT